MPRRTVAAGSAQAAVRVLARDARFFSGPRHRHPEGQLIYAIAGIVSVETDHGTWVVPPNRAVWVPAHLAHATRSHGAVQFRAVLVAAAASRGLPKECCVVEVSPLLRELILRLASLSAAAARSDLGRAVSWLLLQELTVLPAQPLDLPMPQHAALARYCRTIQTEADREIALEEAAAALHMSRSSFMRLFRHETGLSFGRWRQQSRLLHALALLAEGRPILGVALDCGYSSPSAFTAVFRRTFGRTPTAYFSN